MKTDKNIEYLIGKEAKLNSLLEPFSPKIIKFLNDFSKLLDNKFNNKNFPDLKALSFFCRKNNILGLKNKHQNKDTIRFGLGLLFHITPSNIPTNFAYSLIFGLITGNSNIVKVPSKKFDEIEIICKSINNFLNKKKKYKLGIYIYENQNWEKMLNYFWNKYNHKNLFAVPHNEIRYWDLRYYDFYPTSFYKKKLKPRNFLINSFASANIAKLHNFKNQMQAESLRMINFKHKFTKIRNNKMNIFVALDLFDNSSRRLVSILNKNVDKFNNIGKIYIKKHPASRDNYRFSSKKIFLYEDSIKSILPKIDLFIASNSTTAVYYAIFNRIPYMTYVDNGSINLSPLYPKKISYFFDDYSFSKSLKNFNFDKNFQNNYYLYSDTKLNKWKTFLNKFIN